MRAILPRIVTIRSHSFITSSARIHHTVSTSPPPRHCFFAQHPAIVSLHSTYFRAPHNAMLHSAASACFGTHCRSPSTTDQLRSFLEPLQVSRYPSSSSGPPASSLRPGRSIEPPATICYTPPESAASRLPSTSRFYFSPPFH